MSELYRPSTCFTCLKPYSKLLFCSRCKLVGYCSKECQVKAWDKHKMSCDFLTMLTILSDLPGYSPRDFCTLTESNGVCEQAPEDEEVCYNYARLLFLLRDSVMNGLITIDIESRLQVFPGDHMAINISPLPLNIKQWKKNPKSRLDQLVLINLQHVESFVRYFVYLRNQILEYAQRHHLTHLVLPYLFLDGVQLGKYRIDRPIMDEIIRLTTFVYKFLIQALNAGKISTYIFSIKPGVSSTQRHHVREEGSHCIVRRELTTPKIVKEMGIKPEANQRIIKMKLDREELTVRADDQYCHQFLDAMQRLLMEGIGTFPLA